MEKLFFIVDAFTDRLFSGNPACVFLNVSPLEDDLMQSIASEFNLSETAFPVPEDVNDFETNSRFGLRWFTPVVEVPLCGHATLAAAHVIYSELKNQSDSLTFDTESGELVVTRNGLFYVMDFPIGTTRSIDCHDGLISALGIERNHIQENLYCADPNKLIVVVDNEKTVRELSPDFNLLYKVSEEFSVGSIVVTSLSESGEYDIISRNFAPVRGVNEDPVTGSSHVILGPYWQKRLEKDYLCAYQASQRGGFMELEVIGDRILLKGMAKTVASGHMTMN